MRLLDFRQMAVFLILLSNSVMLSPAWAVRKHAHATGSSAGGSGWMDLFKDIPNFIYVPVIVLVVVTILLLWHNSFKDCKCKCGYTCKCKCRCDSSCPCTLKAGTSKGKFER